MAMSRNNALAAVAALRDLSTAQLFEHIQGNQHILAKHYDKAKAQEAAAGGDPQGYFKREDTQFIRGLADFKTLSERKKGLVLGQIGNPKQKQISLGIGRFNKKNEDNPLAVKNTFAVDGSVVMDIVHRVLSSGTVELRRARGNAQVQNNRFVAVDVIPAGFVGRSIDGAGAKSRTPGHAVVVISAPGGGNPQIVTAFPADQDYAEGTALLV